MPDHVVQPDGHPAVVLVDDLVVVAGHPTHAPVISDVFAGQLIAAQRGPYAVGFTFVVTQAQATAVGAYTAPGRTGMCAAAVVFLSAERQQRAGNRPTVRVERVAQRAEVVAVAQATDHINNVKANRRGTDIGVPCIVLPAHGHASTAIALIRRAMTTGEITGPPLLLMVAIFVGGETPGIHIDQIGTEEHPPIGERRIHLQHGGVRFQIRIATRTVRAPEIMLQRDVQILLTIEVGGITAHAALEPIIFFIVARQAGKGVIILRPRRGNLRRYHGIFVGFQRLLRVAVLRLITRRVTQYHRAFH